MSGKNHAGRTSRERKRDKARQADLMAEAERVGRKADFLGEDPRSGRASLHIQRPSVKSPGNVPRSAGNGGTRA